jgi:DNA-binding transcriptional MerR regulator
LPRKPPIRPMDDDGHPMLKMRELVDATGISSPTILFYVNKGLLPLPVKTSPNVAFYPFSIIERINFIKTLQSSHRLSLAQIKKILGERDRGREVAPLIEMHEEVFGRDDAGGMDPAGFSAATGLAPDQIEAAVSADLLLPREPGRFDAQDLAIGRALQKCLDLGLSLDDAAYYPKLAGKIVDEEMAVQERVVRDRPYDRQLAATMELTRIARALRGYVIDRMFQRRALGQEEKQTPGVMEENQTPGVME